MKKILFSLAGASLSFLSLGQLPVSTTPANKNIVLEEFTGIYCTFCPDGHKIASDLKVANPGRVVLVNVHTGDYANPSGSDPDFRTPLGAALANQTGLTGYPSGTVNRHIFAANKTALSRSNWSSNGQTILAESSYVNIALEGEINVANNELIVDVEMYFTGATAPGSVNLNVVLLQNNVEGPQTGGSSYNPTQILPNGNYNHGHMLRDMLTGQWGEVISTTTQGTTVTKQYVYPLPTDINGVSLEIGDLEIAAFVAEGQQEIITGANGPITIVTPPGSSVVDLSSATNMTSPTSYCSSMVTPKLTITNNSTVVADTFQVSYSINGGTSVTQDVFVSLPAMGTTTVSFPNINLSTGLSIFEYNVEVSNASTIYDFVGSNNKSRSQEIIVVSSTAMMLPVTEDFESAPFDAPANSFALNPQDITALGLKTASTPATSPIGGFQDSDGSFIWNFYGIVAGERSSILYDKLSFVGGTDHKLKFDHSYAQYANEPDKLEIEVSTDCGVTWATVFNKSGASLATSPAFGSGNFFPTRDLWNRNIVDLSAYDGEASVLVKFTGISGYGNNLFIDNIFIGNGIAAGIEENEFVKSLELYPNPALTSTVLNFKTTSNEEVSVNIVDLLGKVVYTKNYGVLAEGNYTKEIDVTNLSKGMFILNVVVNEKTVSEKLIVE